jgi:hypothetical protein
VLVIRFRPPGEQGAVDSHARADEADLEEELDDAIPF